MAIGKTNSIVGGTDISDATALASDILTGKSAYIAEGKVDGTIPLKAAATYTPTTSDQTIASGQYLSGTQTIVGDADLVAGNIKSGVNIFGVTGTFTDDADATTGDMLNGKTAYVGGVKVTGNIATKTSTDMTASGNTVTAPAGYYASAASKAVASGKATTPATTITVAPTISVDASTGLITATNSGSQSVTPTVSAGYVTTGTAGTITVDGSNTNQMTVKAATSWDTRSSDRTILTAGTYLTGAQTVKGVLTSNITAANVKAGVTVKVGDSSDDDRIIGITGTFTADGTAEAGDILSSKIAYVNGAKVTGTIATKAAATYYPSTAKQTIAAAQYLGGAQTVAAVTTSNITAANIKTGVVVKVGDSGNASRITQVTGTFTSDATAAAGDILSAKTAYVNGAKVTGTILTKSSADLTNSNNTVTVPIGYYSAAATKTVGTAKAAATYYTSTADRTIAAGYYTTGAQTIKSVTTANITAANIKTGVTVTVGDASSAGRIKNITGTFTSDATAAAGDILSAKTAYVNGTKVTGTILTKSSADLTASNNTVTVPIGYYSAAATKTVGTAKAATTYNTSTADRTIAAGYYTTGTQTIKSVTTSNIVASNIKAGVVVTVGDANSAGRIKNITGTLAYMPTIISTTSKFTSSFSNSFYTYTTNYFSIIAGRSDVLSNWNALAMIACSASSASGTYYSQQYLLMGLIIRPSINTQLIGTQGLQYSGIYYKSTSSLSYATVEFEQSWNATVGAWVTAKIIVSLHQNLYFGGLEKTKYQIMVWKE